MYPLLDVQDMEVSYGAIPVVSDINIRIEEGEILGIVGESGSGKSTVAKGIMGLLGSNGAVTKGDIFYRNQNILDLNQEALRKLRGSQMTMVFQNASASLCPIRKLGEQLYETISQHEKVTRKDADNRALEMFEKIGLMDGKQILKAYPFQLSGGMNQRVCIAMAMLLHPGLLLADEPTSALDVTVQAQVLDELIKMRDLYGTAIAIVTHNIGIVERMADKVAVMWQGKIVEYGTKDEVIYHPQEAYTRKLLNAVLRLKRG